MSSISFVVMLNVTQCSLRLTPSRLPAGPAQVCMCRNESVPLRARAGWGECMLPRWMGHYVVRFAVRMAMAMVDAREGRGGTSDLAGVRQRVRCCAVSLRDMNEKKCFVRGHCCATVRAPLPISLSLLAFAFTCLHVAFALRRVAGCCVR